MAFEYMRKPSSFPNRLSAVMAQDLPNCFLQIMIRAEYLAERLKILAASSAELTVDNLINQKSIVLVSNFMAGDSDRKSTKIDASRDNEDRSELYQIANGETQFVLFQQLPQDVKIMQIACTEYDTFVLTVHGRVYSWGVLDDCLGRDSGFVKQRAGTIRDTAIPIEIPELSNIVQIAASSDHVLALDLYGMVYSWGSGKFGQLGLGERVFRSDRPKKIEYFEGGITQIYAGTACSYAVNNRGELYQWGRNRNGGKDGFEGTIIEPVLVEDTPWVKRNADPVLVLGKDQRGYLYNSIKEQRGSMPRISQIESGGGGGSKKLEFKVKELEAEIASLKSTEKDLRRKIVGSEPTEDKKYTEDNFITQLESEAKKTDDEIHFIKKKIKHINGEVMNMEGEIDNMKRQIKEIQNKEQHFSEKIEKLEEQIGRESSKNSVIVKDLIRQRNGQEDLAKSNEQVKNMIQQKCNEREEQKIELESEIKNMRNKKNDLEARKAMLTSITRERKALVAEITFKDDRFPILSLIDKLFDIFNSAKDTTLEEIIRRSESEKGLMNVIYEGEEIIKKLQKESDILKSSQPQSLIEVANKLHKMFNDSLELRLEVNRLSKILLMETDEKLNDDNIDRVKKKMNESPKKGKDERITTLKAKYAEQKNTADIQIANSPHVRSSNVHMMNNSPSRGLVDRSPSRHTTKSLMIGNLNQYS